MAQLVNDRCICDSNALDPEITRTHKGKTIGFCSEECMSEWDKLSEKQKEAHLMHVTHSRG